MSLAAVPIPASSDPLTALQQASGCNFNTQFQPWKGLEIVGPKGEAIGFAGEVLLSDGGEPAFLELLSPTGSVSAISLSEVQGGYKDWAFAGKILATDRGENFSLEKSKLTNLMTGTSIDVNRYSSQDLGTLMTSAWDKGFNPYGDMIIVAFETVPVGASVSVGTDQVGSTSISAWVDPSRLADVRLTLEGYLPCTFVDGVFSGNTGGPATFTCTLQVAPGG
jgi:hypothetical protein